MILTRSALVEGLNRREEDCRQLLTGLSDGQISWHSPDSWSIAQCLDHMNVTLKSYQPRIYAALSRAPQEPGSFEAPYRVSLLERWFLYTLEPPVRIPFRSPRAFLPSPNPSPTEVREQFFLLRTRLREGLRKAKGLDLQKTKIPSPVLPWFRIGLGTAFAAMVAHDRRHLWQIERIMKKRGFPGPRPDVQAR